MGFGHVTRLLRPGPFVPAPPGVVYTGTVSATLGETIVKTERDLGRPMMIRPLTGRQQQIMDAVLDGASNRVIAQRLGLREQTVKNQLTRIYRKLGIAGRVQLAVVGMRERTT